MSVISPPEVKPTLSSSMSAGWAAQIVRESIPAKCTSIGLTCGSREPNSRRVIDTLARELSQQALAIRRDNRLLLLRLHVFQSMSLERQDDQPQGAPRATASPLGDWSEVAIPMPVGKRASWSLQNLPRWLPAWKSEFRFVMIDLGPMHLVPSRTIGRLCDRCYVVLGPDACASHAWILEHVAWHDRSGSPICGTILTTVAKAA